MTRRAYENLMQKRAVQRKRRKHPIGYNEVAKAFLWLFVALFGTVVVMYILNK